MVARVKLTKWTLSDFDRCGCGDYRKDHKDGVGACSFNGKFENDAHGGVPCLEFRLMRPATEFPPSVKGLMEQ